MATTKTLRKPDLKKPRSSELLIIPTKKLINWYKYKREV
jgi:hypothetical protein